VAHSLFKTAHSAGYQRERDLVATLPAHPTRKTPFQVVSIVPCLLFGPGLMNVTVSVLSTGIRLVTRIEPLARLVVMVNRCRAGCSTTDIETQRSALVLPSGKRAAGISSRLILHIGLLPLHVASDPITTGRDPWDAGRVAPERSRQTFTSVLVNGGGVPGPRRRTPPPPRVSGVTTLGHTVDTSKRGPHPSRRGRCSTVGMKPCPTPSRARPAQGSPHHALRCG
jgi:hypothetical protein